MKMNGVDMRTMLLLEAPLEPQSVCIDIDAHDFIVSVGNLDFGNHNGFSLFCRIWWCNITLKSMGRWTLF